MKSISISIKILYFLAAMFIAFVSQSQEEQVSPFIHVNQIGFSPASPKIAFVSSNLGLPFNVVKSDTNKIVLKGMLKLAEAGDRESGENVWAVDFSIVEATGTFFIEVEGLGKSYPFQIKPHLFRSLSNHAMRSFYYQRCGAALSQKYAGEWNRSICHQTDGMIFSATDTMDAEKKLIDVTGGWHDGSDYGKYVASGAFSVGMLLTLYEIMPNVFPDRSINIPESGNGVPDILDEVRWEIEWLLKMQSESGGVYHKVTSLESGNPHSPLEKNESRVILPISTAATASCCALFAKASRLYHPHDATFSARCLNAAQRAWSFLEKRPSDGGFKNPPEVSTKMYSDPDDDDERLWAAVELSRTTGEDRIREIVSTLAERRAPFLSATGYWGNVMPLVAASILQATEDTIDEDLKEIAINDVLTFANTLSGKNHSDGYRLSIQSGEFTWGSNNLILQNAVLLLLAHSVRPHTEYINSAYDQLHYVLGRNPLSKCFVTGYGSDPPKNPYNFFLITDKVKDTIPGLLVGGANQFLNDSVLKRTYNEATPPSLTYLDVEESFASNETSISWNSALVFVVTFLDQWE